MLRKLIGLSTVLTLVFTFELLVDAGDDVALIKNSSDNTRISTHC